MINSWVVYYLINSTILYTTVLCVLTGVDLMDDIRLDVQEAREAPTAHPQWEFEVILFQLFF